MDVLQFLLGRIQQQQDKLEIENKTFDPSKEEKRTVELHNELVVNVNNLFSPSKPSTNIFEYGITSQTNTRHSTWRTQTNLMYQMIPNKITNIRKLNASAFCCSFSPCGEVFCVASQDACVRLFDAKRWNLIKEIEAREISWSIIDVDMSSDTRFVIYSSWSNNVQLCNVRGKYELHEAMNFGDEMDGRCMFGIKFTHDASRILSGCSGGICILYDVEKKQRISSFFGHQDDVNHVCFLDESPHVCATASDDTLCSIWDFRESEKSRKVGSFIGHYQGLTSVASKLDGRYILTSGKDHCMKLWDLRSLSSNASKKEDDGNELKEEDDGRYFDYRYEQYQPPNKKKSGDTSVMTYRGHMVRRTLQRANFSPLISTGQRYVYTGCATGKINIYDILTGKLVHSPQVHQSIVREVSWHPTLPMLATASWDGTSKTVKYKC